MFPSNDVECYASSSYPQRPQVIHWRGQRLEVQEIISQWRQPEGFGFRLHTQDDQVFEVLYLIAENTWQVGLASQFI